MIHWRKNLGIKGEVLWEKYPANLSLYHIQINIETLFFHSASNEVMSIDYDIM